MDVERRINTPVKSKVQYDALVAGNSVSWVNDADRSIIRRVASWLDAVECSKVDGTYLQIGYATVNDRLDMHGNFIDNTAKALERRVTFAVAQDADLILAYGDLEVLNRGFSITIYKRCPDTGKLTPYMEIDGLVKNHKLLLMIECKMKMQSDYIRGKKDGRTVNLMVERCKLLQEVLENDGMYVCSYKGLWKVCGDLRGKVLPIAAAENFPADCETLCDEDHVNYVKPCAVGGGFQCTIREEEGVAELARKRPAAIKVTT